MLRLITISAITIVYIANIDCKRINIVGNNRQGRAALGAECSDSDKCTGDFQQCYEKKCKCKDGYKEDSGKCVLGEVTLFAFLTLSSPFDPKLKEKTSTQYTTLETAVKDALKPKFCPENKFPTCSVTVLRFTEGSTMTDVSVTLTALTDDAKKHLETELATVKTIDGASVTPGSVSNVDFGKCQGQCEKGEGDCDNDEDCNGEGLLCGVNNCGSGKDPLADCCYAPEEAGTCDENNINMWACCSDKNECGEGEGDCDSNDDCKTGFICGRNNCPDKFKKDPFFPQGQADCCTSSTKASLLRLGVGNFLDGEMDDSDWQENFQNNGEPGFQIPNEPRY